MQSRLTEGYRQEADPEEYLQTIGQGYMQLRVARSDLGWPRSLGYPHSHSRTVGTSYDHYETKCKRQID